MAAPFRSLVGLPNLKLASLNNEYSTTLAKTTTINNVNNSTAFASSGDACLDLFLNTAVRTGVATPTYMKEQLPLAWSRNPLITLKLIFSIRDIAYDKVTTGFCKRRGVESVSRGPEGRTGRIQQKLKQKHLNRGILRYERDPDYKPLYDWCTDHFAECLEPDLEKMKQSDFHYFYSSYRIRTDDDDDQNLARPRVTEAASCCIPRHPIEARIVRRMLLCESIARKVFPPESYPEEYKEADYYGGDRVVNWLRREFLLPLSKYELVSWNHWQHYFPVDDEEGKLDCPDWFQFRQILDGDYNIEQQYYVMETTISGKKYQSLVVELIELS